MRLSDEAVRDLFVTPRIVRLAGAEQQPEKLLMPPPSRRRTLIQIQQWFQMGNDQRRKLMDEEADVTIIPSLADDTIYWDGAWRTRPPVLPFSQKTCSGVSRAFIQNLDPDRYDDEARARILLGFYHTFREGLANRAETHPST